ncbi:hypothetical protein BD779DRAFT_1033687 [Infundibulicybe gibba]|nr:hypothetical protein BD779DRAFT_1033687 [Infundibulicybe gibba]
MLPSNNISVPQRRAKVLGYSYLLRWRAIALFTPALWAAFYIHPFWHDSVPYTSILHTCILRTSIFRTWISRAAQSTLSFEFHNPYPHPHVQVSPMIEEVVFPVIHRCSLLSIHVDVATMHRLLVLPPRSLQEFELAHP